MANYTSEFTGAEIDAGITLANSAQQPPAEGAFVDGDKTKLDSVEAGATADQTASEIRALVESATDSHVFTDADHSKLDGIEAGADVTSAAGAVMESDVTNLDQVLTFDPADYATAVQGGLADSAVQPGDLSTVATSGAYADLTGTPSLATVATSGDYSDLAGAPTLSTVATTGSYGDLSGTPSLATVATSGDYTDLSNKPSIPSAIGDLSNVSDATATTGQVLKWDGAQWAPAADDTSGGGGGGSGIDLTDLSVSAEGTPSGDGSLSYNSTNGVFTYTPPDLSVYATAASLETVATTGAYSDLTGAPDLSTYVESDPSGVTGADAITNIISLTQDDYDAITPDAATVYVISG